MRWLEIIDVEPAGLKERLRIIEIFNAVQVPRSARLELYQKSFSNELSIHFQWESPTAPQGGRSPLGRELSRTFGDYGLVTHALWVEGNQFKPNALKH
jgi:hypothetical protein